MLTSERGLKQQVNHAVRLRATLPAFPALYGGELVLLSEQDALALDERLTLASIITRLGDVGVGAIAYVGSPAAVATAAAAVTGLPLLNLPDSSSLKAVERDVLYLLNHRDLQVERRAAQLYHALTQHVSGGDGIEALLRTVQQATGHAVGFYDAARNLRCQVGEQPDTSFGDLQPAKLSGVRMNGHPFVVKRVGTAEGTFGYVALAGPALDQWDDAAASQAAAALLLELAKQQAIEAVETRVGGELLDSIVRGAPADMATLRERAAELGYNLRQPHAALLIASADGTLSTESIRDRLQKTLRRAQMSAPHVLCGDAVLCLLPCDHGLERAWQVLRALATGAAISAGISRPAATAADWQRAYGEAEQALELGRHLFGPSSLTAFRDLHVYRLLFALRSSPEVWNFYQTTLSALVDYDRVHHTELLVTLEAYFEAQSNLSRASERLAIHRNTLLYRLRRIAEISGSDLESPDDMLALKVALKAHRILSSPTIGPSGISVVPTSGTHSHPSLI